MPAQSDPVGFAPRARGFLEELSRNNDHRWFTRHKARYAAEVRRPAETLMSRVSPLLERATGQPVRLKLFRPHRDVRRSNDKTPYHSHLHAVWALPDGRGWYFGLAPDYACAGGGIMAFDEAQTQAWRRAVDSDAGEALEHLLAAPEARLDPPTRDAPPEPFPATHPRAALLRREGCVLWFDSLFDALSDDPEACLRDVFTRLQPLQDWLGHHL